MNMFTIYSLFYSVLLNIVYFARKRLVTFENKIFEKLMITNLIGVILAIGSYFTIVNIDKYPIFNVIVSKGYIVYLLTWITLFSVYIFAISIDDSKNRKKKINRIIKGFSILYVIFLIVIIIKPLYYHNAGGAVYSYGPSANVMYVVSSVYIAIWIVRLIINYKKIRDKKYLPIFAFMLLGVVVIIIQKSHPELLLMTSMETFIVFLMYHTIENPDMKILEEVHRAKEISDNANEEKTMFLYNMTNEIRNITKDIDYSADDILDETSNKKVDVEVINDAAREIKGSTAKFTTMTNEILDINSIDSASIKIYNDKYNVKLIIKELVTVYSKKCNVKNIAFRPSIASDIPEYLYGDSVGLKQVLDIILDNSVKYTSSGYIEFNVNAIIKNNIARLIITVEDSGTGMKADDIIKVFNKKNDRNEDSLNLNNNLYNAKALITLMGGTIIPSSIYGTGTTMKIVLDQKVAKEADEKLDKYEEVYDKKKILLVDDNISTEKIVSKLLKDTNIELDYVSLGKEALDKIRGKEKYDLILLDEVMDPLDGVTVMKKFKDIRNFKTNVILLTRNNEYEYNEEYLKYGFSGYLLKPISKDKLFEIIDKYLK
ncbi:MAG: hybrid sensor histidine kinase/response regulator [Bacilli bacterium]|jgi:signal transduction histidine kinase/CheY-like chemotaxis protein